MQGLRRMLIATAVAVMMVLTVVPVTQSDAESSDSGPYQSDRDYREEKWKYSEDKVPFYRDHGNDSFTLEFPFLKDHFGYKVEEAPVVDPFNGVVFQQYHELYFSNDEYSKVVRSSGFDVEDVTDNPHYDRMVTFGATFTSDAMGECRQDIVYYGLDFETRSLILKAGPFEFFVPAAQYADMAVSTCQNLGISTMQSMNILPFAVGNFDEDIYEEIALFHWSSVMILDFKDGEIRIMADVPLTTNPYGHDCELTPVSMDAGDIDGDSIDEIVVAVEYAKNVRDESLEYPEENVAFGEHQTLLSIIDGDSFVTTRLNAQHNMIFQGSINQETEILDTVMTSVVLDDYDRDGVDDIVLGGYLWDNNNTSPDHTCDPRYAAGELFLAVLDDEKIVPGGISVMEQVTVLQDDNGRATNGTEEFTKNRDFRSHGSEVDTSILLYDYSDNSLGFCRSPNWINWTVPMEAFDPIGGGAEHRIYFDNSVNVISKEGQTTFERFLRAYCPFDNNNAAVLSLDSGHIGYDDEAVYLSTQMFRFIWMDTYIEADIPYPDDMMWYPEICDDSGPVWMFSQISYADVSWEHPVVTGCIVDIDPKNTFIAKHVGTFSTCSAPMILAAISGVPYDQDYADMLLAGSSTVGMTSITNTTSAESSQGDSFEKNFSAGGSFDWFFGHLVLYGGFVETTEDSRTQTIVTDISYSSARDSIALYVEPTVCYAYEVYEKQGDEVMTTIQCAFHWLKPLTLVLNYSDYVEFVDLYNRYSGEFMDNIGGDYTPIEKVNPFTEHVEGDVESYTDVEFPEVPRLAELSTLVGYSGQSEDRTEIYAAVTIGESEEHSYSYANQFDLEAAIGFYAMAGAHINGIDTKTITSSSYSGTSYSTMLVTGAFKDKSPGLADEEVLKDYGLTTSFWAIDHPAGDFVYAGYTVDSYTSNVKNGEVKGYVTKTDTVDGMSKVVDNIDPDDPNPPGCEVDRNPGKDFLYLKLAIPGDVREDLMANRYVLEMEYQAGNYLDFSALGQLAGYKCYTEVFTGYDPVYTDEKGVFYPTPGEDRTVFVCITGLPTPEINPTFNFRLKAVGDDDVYNTTLTASVSTDVNSKKVNILNTDEYTIREGKLYAVQAEPSLKPGILVLDTSLPEGIYVDVVVLKHDGSGVFHTYEDIYVGQDGVILVQSESLDRGDVPPLVVLILFGGILICLAAGAWVLRQDRR